MERKGVLNMIFSLLGGDARSVYLYRSLRADGHEVRAFALERRLPDCAGNAEEALSGADCAILPLPCVKDGMLNAPYSQTAHTPEALLCAAAPGTLIFAGSAPAELCGYCRERGLELADYGKREDFTLRNAELTAEGALSLLLNGTQKKKSLRDSRVLVAGFGRIGRALAAKLTALGASVTVAARSATARTAAELAGCTAVSLADGPFDRFDAVVNTIPSPVFDRDALERFGDARLIELASPPYGLSPAAAEALGKHIELAAGLPGKTAPASAAEAVKKTIYAILRSERIP